MRTKPGKRSSNLIDSKIMTHKELRNYGLMMGLFVVSLFGLLLPLAFKKAHPLWPFIVGAVFWALALVIPSSLRVIYAGWMRFGLVMGKINSTIILSLVYFVLFVPVALFFRLTKRDRLYRAWEKNTTYRILRENKTNLMEKPY